MLIANDIPQVLLYYKPKKTGVKINSSKDTFDYILPLWNGVDHYESFYCILLNRANNAIGFFEVGKGGITATVADIKIILQSVIIANATALIIVHNHPSGNLTPSELDIRLTRQVKEAATLIGSDLIDHLIISSNGYFSFADESIL